MTIEEARRLLDAVKDGSTFPSAAEIREALRLTGDLTKADDVGAH